MKFSLVLVIFLGTACVATKLSYLKEQATVNSARLYLFYKNASSITGFSRKYRSIHTSVEWLGDERWCRKKDTHIFIHDYVESVNAESVNMMANAYVSKGEFNFMVLDWEQLAGGYETQAAFNAAKIGPFLGQLLMNMLETTVLDMESLHLIGHGMGAHIAGLAGRHVKRGTDSLRRIERITALDPAFYPFYPPIVSHIKSDDAYFVDVIHTDAWGTGAPVSTGSVDFWPNSGKAYQPGCPGKFETLGQDGGSCSHRRAWRYWVESVYAGIRGSGSIFQSKKCSSYFTFQLNRCYQETALANMGLGATKRLRGNYFLQTNARSRFNRGPSGAMYDGNKSNFIFKNIDVDEEPFDETTNV